jgi:hypothetical protein
VKAGGHLTVTGCPLSVKLMDFSIRIVASLLNGGSSQRENLERLAGY